MNVVPITPKQVEALLWGLAQIGDYPDRETDGEDDPSMPSTSDMTDARSSRLAG